MVNPTNIELYLLSQAVEGWFPVHALASDAVEEWTNAPKPYTDIREIEDVLQSLCRHGYMMTTGCEGIEFTPHIDQIRSALHGQEQLHYGLTATGGALWESVAKPNWSSYVLFRVLEDHSVLAAATEIELLKQSTRMYEQGEVDSSVPQVWETLSPWQATYWKKLEIGYTAQFAVYEVDTNQMHDEEYWAYVAQQDKKAAWNLGVRRKWLGASNLSP